MSKHSLWSVEGVVGRSRAMLSPKMPCVVAFIGVQRQRLLDAIGESVSVHYADARYVQQGLTTYSLPTQTFLVEAGAFILV